MATIKTLKLLTFTPSTVTRGIAALRAMPGLERVGTAEGKNYPAKEFWERYDRGEFAKAPAAARAWEAPDFLRWMGEVAALPAAKQAEAVKKKLTERNPGYGGEGEWKIEDRGVTGFTVTSQHLADLTPLRALTALTELGINGDDKAKVDISGLAGLKLTRLIIQRAGVTDLSPLKGMPLGYLDCAHNGIADLSPLKGMPLWLLNCTVNPIVDLSPLWGMQLGHLALVDTRVSDLSPLKGMHLEYLAFAGTNVSDLRPLEGMPLFTVWAYRTPSDRPDDAGRHEAQGPHLHAEGRHPRDRSRPLDRKLRTDRRGLEQELSAAGVLGAVRPRRVRQAPDRAGSAQVNEEGRRVEEMGRVAQGDCFPGSYRTPPESVP